MKGGFRRPFIGMAAGLVAALGGMSQAGIPVAEQLLPKKPRKKRVANNTSSSHKPNGPQECVRRMRQLDSA